MFLSFFKLWFACIHMYGFDRCLSVIIFIFCFYIKAILSYRSKKLCRVPVLSQTWLSMYTVQVLHQKILADTTFWLGSMTACRQTMEKLKSCAQVRLLSMHELFYCQMSVAADHSFFSHIDMGVVAFNFYLLS